VQKLPGGCIVRVPADLEGQDVRERHDLLVIEHARGEEIHRTT
jgi:hypothetical protein